MGPGRRLLFLPLLVVIALPRCGRREEQGAPPGGGSEAAVPAAPAPDTAAPAGAGAPPATEGALPDAVPEAPLEGTEWRLVALPGAPDPPAGAHATLVLEREGGLLHGSTGCGGFDGSWEIAGTRLTLGLGAVGGGRCGPELARLETDYLEALRRAGSFRLRGDTLELLGAEGVVARFGAP